MASQEYIEELVRHKKAMGDERRDSRIRASIESTLTYLNQKTPGGLSDTSINTTRPNTIISHSRTAGSVDHGSAHESETDQRPPMPIHESMAQFPEEARYPMQSHRSSVSSFDVDLEKELGKRDSAKQNSWTSVRTIAGKDTLPDAHDDDHHHEVTGPLTWRQRLQHYTFANYAMTMSTGGVALVLSNIPYRFAGMTGLGTAIFVFNLILFVFVTSTITARFVMYPFTLKNAFLNPHEGFFIATFLLSIATIITNTVAYGIPATNSAPWLIEALRIAFWIYTVVTTVFAICYYHVLFMVKKLVITNVLPGWVLPIFPAMLVGTLASSIAGTQSAADAYPMIIVGLGYQGLGFFLSVAMYGIYFGRLMTSGLPLDVSRPAMFIAVGPPAFTGLALLGMAKDVQKTNLFSVYPIVDIANQALIPDILSLFALVMAIFLWVLAFWFWGIAVLAAFEGVQRNDFHLNWYAYIFPNVGYTIATLKIGERLDSGLIRGVGTIMGSILFFLLFLIYYCHVNAIRNKKIMWPGKDEDAAH